MYPLVVLLPDARLHSHRDKLDPLGHFLKMYGVGQKPRVISGHMSITQNISKKARLRIFLAIYGFTLYYLLDGFLFALEIFFC